MRRADRLYRLVEFLRGRKQAVTGADIAAALEVSLRTVYRDIADLTASGVPVAGERGVGYLLGADYHVPPVMFDLDEIEAMALGAAMVDSWAEGSLKFAAQRALAKIGAILPGERLAYLTDARIEAFPSRIRLGITIDFTALRLAIRHRRKLSLEYTNEAGEHSIRTVWPLALQFMAPVWMLVAWCEARGDFRHFRLDRMRRLDVLDDAFKDMPGRRLIDYKRRMSSSGA